MNSDRVNEGVVQRSGGSEIVDLGASSKAVFWAAAEFRPETREEW